MNALRKEILDRAIERCTVWSDDTSTLQEKMQASCRVMNLTQEQLEQEANSHAVSVRFKHCAQKFCTWAWWQAYQGISESDICAIIREGNRADLLEAFDKISANHSPEYAIKSFAEFQKAAA